MVQRNGELDEDDDMGLEQPGQKSARNSSTEEAAITSADAPTKSVPSWRGWMPQGAQCVSNDGTGDCLALALADCLQRIAPRDKGYNGRQIRQFIVAFMEQRKEEYTALWDGNGPGRAQEALDTFDLYIEKVKKAGAWNATQPPQLSNAP